MKNLAMVPLPAGQPSGGMSISCTARRIGLKETMIRFMLVPNMKSGTTTIWNGNLFSMMNMALAITNWCPGLLNRSEEPCSD